MKYDYFLFDMDNCLIHYPDFIKILDVVLIKTLKDHHVKIPNGSERFKIWNAGIEHQDLLKKWGIFNHEKFWREFNKNDFINRIELIEKGEIYLYDDVLDILSILRINKKKMALISNSPKQVVIEFAYRFEIVSYFDVIFGIDYELEIKKTKPSPLGILSVLRRLYYDNTTSKAIMIGDSIVDIIAAKRAGIDSCLIIRDINKYRDQLEEWEDKPNYIIKNFYEIIEF